MNKNIQQEVPTKIAHSKIACVDCGHKDNPSQAGYTWLVCASCGSYRGFRLANVGCTCGSDIFQITKDRIYCPNCGSDVVWR